MEHDFLQQSVVRVREVLHLCLREDLLPVQVRGNPL